ISDGAAPRDRVGACRGAAAADVRVAVECVARGAVPGRTQPRCAGRIARVQRRGAERAHETGCDLNSLAGIRVIEVSDQFTAIGGRVLAELGADVIVVEPPTGSADRNRPPFARDAPGPDAS